MEVRLNTHGQDKLATKTFFSTENGFEVASVLVMGKQDAVLIDAQWTLANAHRVVAEILETGKNLTAIYLTHAHPDHYFGVRTIADAFPNARILAIPIVSRVINKQFFGKIEYWEEIIGKTNTPRETVEIEDLTENYIGLEGQLIEIFPNIMGDYKWNTVVWVPSIKTLIGSDLLFNQAHPFTCELTAEERKQWIKDLDKFEAMNANVVIPGHQKPGMPFDNSSYTFTRDYLIATEEELLKWNDVGGFYYAMIQRFPEANLFISNDMNANVFKGARNFDWREE